MKKLSFQIAFGGIVSALCILLMFSVGIFPVMLYVFPMISSLLIFILSYECGNRTALASYFSVSFLSVILSPDKESALIFLAFFGYYPILSRHIDRLKSKLVQWIIRFAVFNVSMIASYFVLLKLFLASENELFGGMSKFVLLAIGNIMLVIYDIAIRNVSYLYVTKIRKKLFKRK